jgi:general secretion pathway protein K
MRVSDPRQGMVLVIVLWTIALLAALTMAASMSFRSFAGIVAVDRDRTGTDALLTAGLEIAAGFLATSPKKVIDDARIEVTLSTGSVRAHLSDEGGRIDVGKAPVEVLGSLLTFIGVGDAPEIVRRIIELRDPNEASRSIGVALAAPEGGKPAAAPFSDVRLLARIPGMTLERVAALAPLTTVFGGETVNPMTAPPEVLAALPGMTRERALAILEMRRRYPNDPDRLAALLGPAQKYVAVKSNQAVLVELSARLASGFSAAARAVIVRLADDKEPYRTLAWTPQPLS